MKATQQDIIDFVSEKYDAQYISKGKNGKLYIHGFLSFSLFDKKYTELPDGLVFVSYFMFGNTNLRVLPDDIVLGGYVELNNTRIKHLPKTAIPNSMNMCDTDIILHNGLYIGNGILSKNTKYEYLHLVKMCGYFINGSIIS